MPRAAAKPCGEPGCPALVAGRATRCEVHADAQRRAFRPCRHPGCPRRALIEPGAGGGCAAHEREARRRRDRARSSSSQRGYGAAWRRVRARHLKRHPSCVVCGVEARHVDHIVSRERGGTDEESNLQSLCSPHHSSKTARVDGRWGRAG